MLPTRRCQCDAATTSSHVAGTVVRAPIPATTWFTHLNEAQAGMNASKAKSRPSSPRKHRAGSHLVLATDPPRPAVSLTAGTEFAVLGSGEPPMQGKVRLVV